MRIVGGKWARKHIFLPKALPVRPTMDMARESLFNILNHRFSIAHKDILDLFSGSGIVSLEFASHNAKTIDMVENNFRVIQHLNKLADHFDFQHKIIQKDVFQFLKNTSKKYDIVFADPPYNHKRIRELPDLIFKNQILSKSGILILEHPQSIEIEHTYKFDTRKFGQSMFSFFQA